MSSTRTLMLEHFQEQAAVCEEFGSPFTARSIERFAADFEAGGPLRDLVGDWPTHPRADALSMRLCGALHAAALTARDPALAAEYPGQRPDWNIAALWPIAHAFLVREKAWVAEFIRSAPQTNEVRRSIALLTGFLTFAKHYPGEIETLEIGASAGLNLNWDKFSYQTEAWRWGPEGGVLVETEWHGAPPPLGAAPRIRSRAACDLNPLDVSDPAQRLQLRSYIWADQRERLARFDAAADVAVATGQRVERCDAADWLRQRLAARPRDAATLVYHSVFWQYPPAPVRAAIREVIQSAGEAATREAPVAWLRLEPEALLGGQRNSMNFWVELVSWPGPVRRLLAITDGHARRVESLVQQ